MKIKLILFTLLVTVSSALSGQEIWTLQKCIEHARENNLSVDQAEIAAASEDINLKQSQHRRYPSLSFGSGLNWNFGRSIDPTTNTFISQTFFSNTYSLNSGVRLYGGRAINNTIEQTRINKEAIYKDLEQMKNDISLQIVNGYINVLFARERVDIARNQLSLVESQLDQLEKLINHGVNPANDRLGLEAQVLTNRQSLVQAENNVDLALLNLKQMLRLDPDFEMDVDYPNREIPVTLDPNVMSFKEVYDKAISTQHNIKANELRIKSAEKSINIANAGRLPSLDFGTYLGTNYSNQGRRIDGFETERDETVFFFDNAPVTVGFDQVLPILADNPYLDQIDENLSYGFGFQLSVPIYNNYNNLANIQKAKLGVERAKISAQQTKDNLKTNVQTALMNARAAKVQYEMAQKSHDAQDAAYKNAQKQFDLGNLNTFNYETARNNLDNAATNRIIAKYDYLFKSKVLDYYLGNPIKL